MKYGVALIAVSHLNMTTPVGSTNIGGVVYANSCSGSAKTTMTEDTPESVRIQIATAVFNYGEKPTQENARIVRELLTRFEHVVRVYAALEVYDRGRYY